VEFAFWTIPDSPATVIYSLPLFQEIDFAVNEGYRKIPHGGVEVGGLLFGSADEKGTRIEAFRPIECEHASGPSFLLSERDLGRLETQLASAGTDPELNGLKAVGWFLAHTRGPMQLTDRELAMFDRFFPEANRVTVLVKPERFQPTRFGFLVRASDGKVARDASQHAIILPLPGRAKQPAGGPVPAIPAPTASVAALRRFAESEEKQQQAERELVREGAAGNGPAPDPPASKPRTESPIPPAQEVEKPPEKPLHKPVSKKLILNKMQWTAEQDRPAVLPPSGPMAGPRMGAQSAVPAPTKSGVPTPSEETASPRQPALPDPYEQLERLTRKKPAKSKFRLIMVLPFAALLGCAVGYWAYMRLPAAIIPLHVRGLSQTVLVSWPPDATRDAVYAAIRVDNGAPVLLSPEERVAGQVEVNAGVDVKVELIARNWMRDSRGIVRYVKAANLRSRPAIP
jgi:hypothetical protein